jgi:predicted ATP-grasp superfamily ATP-dependent carboligase
MKIYVYEELMASPTDPSLSPGMESEARAMLERIVQDLAPIADVVPILHEQRTWSAAEGVPQRRGSGETFSSLIDRAEPDAGWLVIAPETDGVLLQRTQSVEARQRRLLSPGSRMVELGQDKLRFARAFAQWSPPTTESIEEMFHASAGVVAKRRDGAGCQQMVAGQDRQAIRQYVASRGGDWIFQPWLRSESAWPASVALIGRPDGPPLMLPLAGQRLELLRGPANGLAGFRYAGGVVPAVPTPGFDTWIEDIALELVRQVGAFVGYVGLDLLMGTETPLIELNPRLTTSYVGYSHWIARASGRPDAMGRLLIEGRWPEIDPNTPAVHFSAAGAILST